MADQQRKKAVQSFIEFLSEYKKSASVEGEGIDVTISCLQETFGIPQDSNELSIKPLSFMQVFNEGLRAISNKPAEGTSIHLPPLFFFFFFLCLFFSSPPLSFSSPKENSNLISFRLLAYLDPKFADFLEKAKEKGYFKGVDEGSEGNFCSVLLFKSRTCFPWFLKTAFRSSLLLNSISHSI